jgi:hemolysin activation/secretion protein
MRRRIAIGLACACALGLASIGVAQVGASRDEVLRLPAPLRASASDFGATDCATESVVGLLPDEVALGTFVVLQSDGVTVLSDSEIEQLTASLMNAPVSRAGLARLIAAIECRYRSQGYVFARATVDASAADSGVFRLSVREGVVSRVEAMAEDEALARLALRAFGPVREGLPLQAADVRRGLAQAAAVGLTDIRPTIRRSRLDPSQLDLVLIVTAAPTQYFTQATNANAESLGRWGLLGGGRWSGLTSLEEVTTLGAYASGDFREQASLQFDTQALISERGWVARLGGAFARARPGAILAPLEIESRTFFGVAEASVPVSVRRGQVAYGRVGLEYLDQNTDFFGDLPLSEDKLRVAYVGVRVDGLTERSVWNLDMQWRRGLSIMGASRPGDFALSRFNADPQASVLRLAGELAWQLPKSFSARAALSAQWTDNALPSFEQLAFGGLTGGLGFDPGALSGDRGAALAVQIFAPQVTWGEQTTWRPYLQVAAARLRTVDDTAGFFDAEGYSMAAGLQVNFAGRWQLEALWAEPFGGIRGTGPDAYESRVLVKLSASFQGERRDILTQAEGGR